MSIVGSKPTLDNTLRDPLIVVLSVSVLCDSFMYVVKTTGIFSERELLIFKLGL